MPHPIDPAVLADQRPGSQALLDLGRCHTGAQQLHPRHDTMRGTRDPRQFLLYRPTLGSHYDH